MQENRAHAGRFYRKMVIPGFRIRYGFRFVLLCSLLALASGGSGIAHANSTIDPFTDRLLPVGHLGGAATVIRILTDNYACLAIGDDLLVLDILDPFHPVQVGILNFTGLIVDFHIVGNYAYVLADGRIHVVDLSNPYQPQKLRLLPPIDVSDIDIDDHYLYIAAQDIYIYSLANPTAPAWISTYPSHLNLKVDAAFPYLFFQYQTEECNPLYCVGYGLSIATLDISQPDNPIAYPYSLFVTALVETQDFIFVLEDTRILVIAHADLSTMTPSAIIPLPAPGSGLAIQDNTLYVAGGDGGIHIFDITNPLSPVQQGWESSILDPRSIAVKDHLAFVAGGSQGLGVINVSNPTVPILSGGFRTVGEADHIAISGDYVYASTDRLDIVDISNPGRPKAVSTYNRKGSPAVAGEVLFLAAGEDGLAAVDISNPARLIELDLLDLPGEANAVALEGDYAYVVNGIGLLQKVNVSNPQSMTLVNSVSAGPATDIVISDGYAYLMGESDISFFDITKPLPELEFSYSILAGDGGECSGSGTARGITAEEDRVFVVFDYYFLVGKWCEAYGAAMLVFQRDAQNMWQLSAEIDLPYSRALDVEVSGGIGYALSGKSFSFLSPNKQIRSMRLTVFDAGQPPNSYEGSSYNFTDTFTDWVPIYSDWVGTIALQDDLVVMGNYDEGIHLLQWLPVQKNYLPAIQH
jgi:hypothetical protein